MPTYDYYCSNCNQVSEKVKSIAERDSTTNMSCNICGEVGGLNRTVAAPMVAYSITTPGYGKVSDGFKEILTRIHGLPGATAKSSYL